MDEQPERVLLSQDDLAGEVSTPVAAADDVVDRPPLVRWKRDELRVLGLDLEAVGHVEQELDVTRGAVGAHLELGFDGVALDDPLAEELERHVDLRRTLEGEPEPV